LTRALRSRGVSAPLGAAARRVEGERCRRGESEKRSEEMSRLGVRAAAR
jgi:hypothetical protein